MMRKVRVNCLKLCVCCTLLKVTVWGQAIFVSQEFLNLMAPAHTLIPLGISGYISFQSEVPLKVVAIPADGVSGADFNYLIVSPSNGMGGVKSPASFEIGYALNPQTLPYMVAGSHQIQLSFYRADQPLSVQAATRVSLFLQIQNPVVSAVVGSAVSQPAISPEQLVSIYGSHLSTPPLFGQVGGDGLYPTTLGNTAVSFNGIPAPLLYVSNDQVNCVVPYGVSGQKTVEVILSRFSRNGRFDVPSSHLTLPMQETSPGIFTVDQSGQGQGLIFNVDPVDPKGSTPNSAGNPAAKGSSISILATGAGLWDSPNFRQPIVALSTPLVTLVPKATVSLTIGGQSAKVVSAVAAVGKLGVLQLQRNCPRWNQFRSTARCAEDR